MNSTSDKKIGSLAHSFKASDKIVLSAQHRLDFKVCVCAQGVLNHFSHPTHVLTGAQGLLITLNYIIWLFI
jgi:hypothetical protein